jgi:hypothetical protein
MSGAMGELTHGGLNREQDETIQQLCQPKERCDEAIQQLWQRWKRCSDLQLTREKTTRSLSLNSNQVAFSQAVR